MSPLFAQSSSGYYLPVFRLDLWRMVISHGARLFVPYWINTVWFVRQKLSPDDLFVGLICCRILLVPLSIPSPLTISLPWGKHYYIIRFGRSVLEMTNKQKTKWLMVPVIILQCQPLSCGTCETLITLMTILWYTWYTFTRQMTLLWYGTNDCHPMHSNGTIDFPMVPMNLL